MYSPRLKEATQVCLQGCCPNHIFRVPEPQQTIAQRQSTSAACHRDFAATTKSSFFPNTYFTNHESIPSLQESFIQFLKGYPKYAETAQIDKIRAQDYCKLSVSNHVCLDYIGIGLFSQSQVKTPYSPTDEIAPADSSAPQQCDFPLFGLTFKSVNLKSQLLHGGEGSELESAMKKRIMDFLRMSQDDYSMVFTANRSSAFKLIAESYPFQSSRKLLTVYDHENEALEAMVNLSEKRGAQVMASEFKWPRLRINSTKLRTMIVRKKKKRKHRGLFVFPLQSRMTGASYSYQWMKLAEEHGWHVLLDACALGPKDMDSFGLSLFRPDFLICSFYKIFGENPAGFGCLFVKKSTVQVLENSSGAGIVSIIPAKNLFGFPEDSSGTDTELEQISKVWTNQDDVNTSTSLAGSNTDQQPQKKKHEELETSDVHEKQPRPAKERLKYSEQAELEKLIVSVRDGTAMKETESSKIECRCLDHVDSLGLMMISSRGRYLINWLVSALMKLQHPNRLDNFPLVTIYGPKVKFNRGKALAFNICDWKGEKVEPVLVQKLAGRNNISLGHGFLHRICFSEKSEEEKQINIERNIKEKEAARIKNRKSDQRISVVMVALTFLANFEDVYSLWAFIAQFLDADFVEKERWRYTAAAKQPSNLGKENSSRSTALMPSLIAANCEFPMESEEQAIDKNKESSSSSVQQWSQWQLIDSILPTGGFAHSFGLEAAMQARLVILPEDLQTYIIHVLENTGSLLLPFVYATTISPDTQTWYKLDKILDATLTNEVSRKASVAQGSALMRVAAAVFSEVPSLKMMRNSAMSSRAVSFHHAPIFGLVCGLLGFNAETTQRAYMFVTMRDIISAATRLNLVGPLGAAVLQHQVSSIAEDLSKQWMNRAVDEACQICPLVDIVQGCHDYLFSRLFCS